MRKFISYVILTVFCIFSVTPPQGYAQLISQNPVLPPVGTLLEPGQGTAPAHLMGLTINPQDPFQFDFLIDRGENGLAEDQKSVEYGKLIKYFLAALTIADEDQWVNLSPYEEDHIIDQAFGRTEMGRDLLAQDYILKQLTASLVHPDSELGKEFWNKVYERAHEELGTTNIPVNTFNKVWILPDEAVVFEKDNTAFIIKSHLKVMTDRDYQSMRANANNPEIGTEGMDEEQVAKAAAISDEVVRQVLIPVIEKEVNEGKHFANLRQIYSGMVLAAWYKQALKESMLAAIYADKSAVSGVDQDPKNNNEIYDQYLQAFKRGVFSLIKEDFDQYANEVIPRKYFSGGFIPRTHEVLNRVTNFSQAPLPIQRAARQITERGVSNIDMAQVTLRVAGERPDKAMSRLADIKVYDRPEVPEVSTPASLPAVSGKPAIVYEGVRFENEAPIIQKAHLFEDWSNNPELAWDAMREARKSLHQAFSRKLARFDHDVVSDPLPAVMVGYQVREIPRIVAHFMPSATTRFFKPNKILALAIAVPAAESTRPPKIYQTFVALDSTVNPDELKALSGRPEAFVDFLSGTSEGRQLLERPEVREAIRTSGYAQPINLDLPEVPRTSELQFQAGSQQQVGPRISYGLKVSQPFPMDIFGALQIDNVKNLNDLGELRLTYRTASGEQRTAVVPRSEIAVARERLTVPRIAEFVPAEATISDVTVVAGSAYLGGGDVRISHLKQLDHAMTRRFEVPDMPQAVRPTPVSLNNIKVVTLARGVQEAVSLDEPVLFEVRDAARPEIKGQVEFKRQANGEWRVAYDNGPAGYLSAPLSSDRNAPNVVAVPSGSRTVELVRFYQDPDSLRINLLRPEGVDVEVTPFRNTRAEYDFTAAESAATLKAGQPVYVRPSAKPLEIEIASTDDTGTAGYYPLKLSMDGRAVASVTVKPHSDGTWSIDYPDAELGFVTKMGIESGSDKLPVSYNNQVIARVSRSGDRLVVEPVDSRFVISQDNAQTRAPVVAVRPAERVTGRSIIDSRILEVSQSGPTVTIKRANAAPQTLNVPTGGKAYFDSEQGAVFTVNPDRRSAVITIPGNDRQLLIRPDGQVIDVSVNTQVAAQRAGRLSIPVSGQTFSYDWEGLRRNLFDSAMLDDKEKRLYSRVIIPLATKLMENHPQLHITGASDDADKVMRMVGTVERLINEIDLEKEVHLGRLTTGKLQVEGYEFESEDEARDKLIAEVLHFTQRAKAVESETESDVVYRWGVGADFIKEVPVEALDASVPRQVWVNTWHKFQEDLTERGPVTYEAVQNWPELKKPELAPYASDLRSMLLAVNFSDRRLESETNREYMASLVMAVLPVSGNQKTPKYEEVASAVSSLKAAKITPEQWERIHQEYAAQPTQTAKREWLDRGGLRKLFGEVIVLRMNEDKVRNLLEMVTVMPDNPQVEYNSITQDRLKAYVRKAFESDQAMRRTSQPTDLGGIDFNTDQLKMMIKRDGNGVPLPVTMQDLEGLRINGFVPEIQSIRPVTSLPIFSEVL